MEKARKQYSLWKDAPLPENLKKEAIAIQGDAEEIYDRFCRDMTFGTSGLRGKMGIGTNRINEIVIKRATMGVADYLLSKHEKPKVVIGYDTRKNSAAYAEETARTLAARGIDSYVFMQPVPVPAASAGTAPISVAPSVTTPSVAAIVSFVFVFMASSFPSLCL